MKTKNLNRGFIYRYYNNTIHFMEPVYNKFKIDKKKFVFVDFEIVLENVE